MSNLLPPFQKRLAARIRSLQYIRAVCGLCVLVLVVGLLLLIPTAHAIRAQYDIASQTLSKYSIEGALVSESDIDALVHRLGPVTARLAAPSTPTPTDLMLQIDSYVPPEITISQYAVNDIKTPALVISGTATTRAVLQQFVDMLSKTPGIAKVNSPVSNYVKNIAPMFTITITFTS